MPAELQTVLQDGVDGPGVIIHEEGGAKGIVPAMNAARHDAVLPDDREPPPKLWYEIAVPDCEADMYQ